MIGKLLNLFGILAVATVLGAGGFAGYLWGTGKLNAQRAELIAAVLRGELDGAAETAPTTQPAESEPEEVRARSTDEVRALRKRQHLERLEVERALADLEAQRRLLGHALQDVLEEQEKLVAERQEFDHQRKQIIEAAEDEGFQKELAYVESLSARQAKEHLVRVWERDQADAVRLLIELDVSRGRRILEQLKTPEELKIQTDLLEQIRLQGLESYASSSGKIDGASVP